MATKRVVKPMAKHGFAIPEDELDMLKQTAEDLDTTPSALVRKLVRSFNAGLIKLPKNEAINRSYQT